MILALVPGMVSRRSILTGSAGAGLGLAAAGRSSQAQANPVLASDARDYGVHPDALRNQTHQLQHAIDESARTTGHLFLPPGTYIAENLSLSKPLRVSGIRGLTRLVAPGVQRLIHIRGADSVALDGLILSGNGRASSDPQGGLVEVEHCSGLSIVHCLIEHGAANGITLSGCSGEVSGSQVRQMQRAAIHARDCSDLRIVANDVHDCADNGILVWQSVKRHDGAVIGHNRISRIGSASGGNGQYGNGINVFRAGGVTVSENAIHDCAWSAIRNNAGDAVHIVNNSCLRSGEVAVFCEFGFEGAIVSGNLIDGAAIGISITNFDQGGRLAVCSGNVVRNLDRQPANFSRNAGIAVEADTVVTGNVVETTPGIAYALGWGPFGRNISATGNIARQCGHGIAATAVDGAGRILIASNIISAAAQAAIVGMDHDKVVTQDLALGGRAPDNLMLQANVAD